MQPKFRYGDGQVDSRSRMDLQICRMDLPPLCPDILQRWRQPACTIDIVITYKGGCQLSTRLHCIGIFMILGGGDQMSHSISLRISQIIFFLLGLEADVQWLHVTGYILSHVKWHVCQHISFFHENVFWNQRLENNHSENGEIYKNTYQISVLNLTSYTLFNQWNPNFVWVSIL